MLILAKSLHSMPRLKTIEADSEDTWPEPMLLALADHVDDIAGYQIERARIDGAAERDIALRINRPVNLHTPAWIRC